MKVSILLPSRILMQLIRRTRFRVKFISILLTIVYLFTGCFPVHVEKFDAGDASSGRYSHTDNGITVSVDPFIEEERLKKYFGVDLLAKGILPVFVSIENVKSEDGFILNRNEVRLAMKGKEGRGNTAGNPDYKIPSVFPAQMIAMGTVIFSPLLGLFIHTAAGATQEVAVEIIRNMEEKKIVDKTVYQGGSNSGFLYFSFPGFQGPKTDDEGAQAELNKKRKEIADNIAGFNLSLKNTRTKERLQFSINTGRH
ncbi:MAG: hypothetical protein HZA12_06530 [Nitrospirae bacterium]|nr:hypothetical protein [Nitrospirota bacterium]